MNALTKILAAAAELFRQYGFKSITMDDIARRAGISKKTLYQHFSNKHEVINEAVVWYKEQFCEQCDAAMKDSANAIEGMVRIMTMLDTMYRQLNPVAMFELQRFYPTGYELFREGLIKQDVESVKGNIIQGMAEGYYREDLNADLLARFHIETSLMVMQPNLMVNDRYGLQQVNQEIMELFLYGIMTPKGEKLYQKYKEKYIKQASKI